MKLPDFFYIKQTRTLNNLHNFSVELLAKLYSRNNPNNAYDSEWGNRQISNLSASIHLSSLSKESTQRLLQQKVQPNGLAQRPELDRDMIRLETIQASIEQEMSRLYIKKAALIGWIQAGFLLVIAVLSGLRISH